MKRLVIAAVLFSMIFTLFAGCNPAVEEPEEEAPVPTEDGGVTYADPDYYPVVASPVTLELAVQHLEASAPQFLERHFWKQLEEKTGITLALRTITTEGENTRLMFASRDYPDIVFRLGGVGTLAIAAAELGDMVEFNDEFLNSFMPNWAEIFERFPDVYRMCLYPDGKLYNLPNFYMAEEDINLRDCWIINGDWLDELGMAVPETMNDFTNYLRAVKNGAGTGTIPSNVIPLYATAASGGSNIGVWYTVADAFGLYNGLWDEIVEGGIVKSNMQNPLLIEVMKYMNQLNKEGLMNTDFSNSWSMYTAAIDYNNLHAQPWYVGAYFAWSKGTHDQMIYIAPPITDSGYAPTVRPTSIYTRCYIDAFWIFSKCQYPVAAARLANYLGSAEGSMLGYFGDYGYQYALDEEGKYYIPEKTETDFLRDGFTTHGPCLVPPEIVKQRQRDTVDDISTRQGAYYKMYKDYIPTDKETYPTPALNLLSTSELQEVTDITNNIFIGMRTYVARWVKGTSDVTADWDAAQQKLEDLGIKRLLELKQKAYDLWIKN